MAGMLETNSKTETEVQGLTQTTLLAKNIQTVNWQSKLVQNIFNVNNKIDKASLFRTSSWTADF
jgi:hypothetical protein